MRKLGTSAVLVIVTALLLHLSLPAQEQTENNTEQVSDAGRGGVTMPRPVYTPSPQFTDKARRKKIEGTVMLSVVINADGTVRSAVVTQSLEPGLDKQAIAAVQKWKFTPATKNGKPVPVHMAVETDFRLY